MFLGDLGGVQVSNPSSRKYYSNPGFRDAKNIMIVERVTMAKGGMPPRNKKNFRATKKGAGMTEAGVKAYRRMNPGSKLKTAVTGKVKPGSKAAKRRKSFLCKKCRTNEEVS